MKKAANLNFSLIILVSVLLINCKSENKTERYISELNLTENISDFTSKMTENDTVRITANLTMEHWVRIDELVLTKKNNKLIIQTTVKQDTTYELKYKMRKNTLAELNIENIDNKFEQHFLTNFRRTKINSNENWIYRIINQKDTLKFHTIGLGDKGGCVREYFEFMKNYYPNEKEFKPIEIIEEIKIFEEIELGMTVEKVLEKLNLDINEVSVTNEPPLIYRGITAVLKDSTEIGISFKRTSADFKDISKENGIKIVSKLKINGFAWKTKNGRSMVIGERPIFWIE